MCRGAFRGLSPGISVWLHAPRGVAVQGPRHLLHHPGAPRCVGGAQGMGHCRQHTTALFPSHMPHACQKQFAINWDVPLCLCKEAEQEQKLLFIMPMPLAALRNGEC